MSQKIEISHRTIVFTVFLLIFLWFVYFIRDIILLFFVSLLLMVVLNPVVTKLSRFKIPRLVSIVIIYLFLIGLLVLLITSFTPLIVDQSSRLISLFPILIENVGVVPVLGNSVVSEILRHLGNFSETIVKFTFSAFSNILSLFAVLVLTFYLLLDREKIENGADSILGREWKRKLKLFLALWEKELGGWLRGQLLLMISVGVLTLLGLLALKIPFSLPLALLAGILEIVPIIGPILSAIPAIIVGFNISPVLGLFVVVLYFIVQQIENHLLAPKIMHKSTGINPVIVILSLTVGMKLAGFLGALLAIPVYLTSKIAIRVFLDK